MNNPTRNGFVILAECALPGESCQQTLERVIYERNQLVILNLSCAARERGLRARLVKALLALGRKKVVRRPRKVKPLPHQAKRHQ
jgi:hypothetical protein